MNDTESEILLYCFLLRCNISTYRAMFIWGTSRSPDGRGKESLGNKID